MKILAVNSGSSSLKSTLFEIKGKSKPRELTHINLERVKNHEAGVKSILESLIKKRLIRGLSEIDSVGHRVVHGGEKYTKSVIIDARVLKTIRKLSNLAPLHNPPNLAAIMACKKLLPHARQVAVFDTAFHQTMPEKAFLYGLPYKLYTKHKIRRYGFHGTSHKYVIRRALKLLRNSQAKIVSCHLGNGSSITASIAGRSVDTSMGFTPLEGVIMGTRCGSIDPAIIFHLQNNLGMSPAAVDRLLNFDSGLKGLSGISSDMRKIFSASRGKHGGARGLGHKRAALTIELLAYQIAKHCGAYAAAMRGLDCIIFTGGLGENAFYVRTRVIRYLDFLGFKIDTRKNTRAVGSGFDMVDISAPGSKKIFVIETNEEEQIAQEVLHVLDAS